MAMTIEERKAQLERKQTTQGLGENTTIGGDATNHGRNKGIIEGGLAHDGGLGNGRIKVVAQLIITIMKILLKLEPPLIMVKTMVISVGVIAVIMV